jgi:hypothetical protein
MLNFGDFIEETLPGRVPQINMFPYVNHSIAYDEKYLFSCPCGDKHVMEIEPLSSYRVKILRELPKMRLVLVCPNDSRYLTIIEIKGFLRFKGFETLFGTILNDTEDEMIMQAAWMNWDAQKKKPSQFRF